MRLAWTAAAVMLVACGGVKAEAGGAVATPSAAAPAPSASAPAAASSAPAAAPADVELRDERTATVAGASLTFDGEAEALAWPTLRKAVPVKPGVAVVIGAGRDVPVHAVLRAAWTLRDSDLRIQTADAAGVVRALALRPKPETPAPGCHLAVFLTADGSLRIAAPGGPRKIEGNAPAETLARALADERTRCPIRYVAFGTEQPKGAWGGVFDVAWASTRDGAVGDARIVLATPVHPPAAAPAPAPAPTPAPAPAPPAAAPPPATPPPTK